MTPRILDRLGLPVRPLLTAVGSASLLGAVALAFLPMPLTTLRAPVTALANGTTIALLGLTAAVLGVFRIVQGRDDEAPEPPSFGTPEAANYDSVGETGHGLDESIESVDGTLREPGPSEWWEARERNSVEEEIRAAAIGVLARSHDCSHEEAAAMLEAGTWTTDPRARSFLGGADAPEPPLKMQFYDWLSGEAYDRHVEHTVDEIAARADLTGVETE
ncbi:DUF7269 family protein [Haloarchaeobius iranensis]|uniref:Uncharacterized protein n=1 Tax=Haloarchaeobius iranensis TaxID=996166 RepID=A0A1G9UCM5_9EURY|nr:hypothetical protein [Haloarchaeobius iranensis]SDM57622.1 hypothetical protein SAMN05192554_10456 [Haloarchaeobius iranensis]